jgi:Patatin-like phospholipase
MAKLRLSLTIPGAVSLGAYEGGALAALLITAQTLGEDVLVIDSIGAASAGSMTALMTAQVLLQGKDPVALMSSAWVDQASFGAMKGTGDYPLSSDALTGIAEQILGAPAPTAAKRTVKPQTVPVQVSLSLTSLAGLTYKVADLQRPDVPPIAATTFQDWYDHEFTTETTDWVDQAQRAIASGSNAMGFPAKRINRHGDGPAYAAAGLEGFTDDFWYTDGGTTDNEPLGRTIDLSGQIESDDDRLYLLIHYDTGPSGPHTSSPWSGTNETPPPFVKTATRALHAQTTQSIFDDLKKLQKTNARLAWTSNIAPALTAALKQAVEAHGVPADVAEQVRDSVVSALTESLMQVREDKAKIAEIVGKPTDPKRDARAATYPTDLEPLIDALVREASGLESRKHVSIDLVSPSINPKDQQQCAGAFLFHFGGFFELAYRRNDFDLGFRNMRTWITDRLLATELKGIDPEPVLAALKQAYDDAGWERGEDETTGPELSLLEKAALKGELLEFGAHLAHVVAHDSLHQGL